MKTMNYVVASIIICVATFCTAPVQAASQPCPPLTLVSRALTKGVEGTPYRELLQIFGGVPPFSTILKAGLLPPGIRLASNGEISGTPTSPGNYEFSVTAVDSCRPMGQSSTTVLFVFVNKKGQNLSGPEPSVKRKPPLKVSMVALPEKISIRPVPDTRMPIRYKLTAQPADTATMDSPGGSFVVNGSVAETTSAPLTAVLLNGIGEIEETVNISKRVLDFARRENAGKIIYSRAFVGRLTTTIAVVEISIEK